MLLHRFLEESAGRAPDAIALIEPDRRCTYDELNRLANRFAHLCVRSGVARGDRVVIALDNCIELVAAYFGTMKAGAVAVPLAGGPRSDRLPRVVADCTPRLALVDQGTARQLEGNERADVPAVVVLKGSTAGTTETLSFDIAISDCPDSSPGIRSIDLDLAAIIYTSGTTGEPRGVMLTHRNFVANARSIVSYLGLTERDRVMCVLPFHYVYGLSLLHTHVAVGGSIVVDNRFTFPNVVLDVMAAEQVTGFAGVPSTFALLLHRSKLTEMDFSSLRYVTQAGGGMPAARILEWLQRGPQVPFFVMYGATEAGARLTYLPPQELKRKLGSIGRPIPNVEVIVTGDDGERVPAGTIGELVARGSNVACGYWNNPEETRQKFSPLGYQTGDLGYTDDDGYLYVAGRRHDMIKVGAHRVGAKEIEDVLHEHAAVHEAAVVGVPHDLLGEAPVAFVSLTVSLADPEKALQAFCAGRLAAHKVPLHFVVKPELPKLSGTGKIDRPSLREMAVLS